LRLDIAFVYIGIYKMKISQSQFLIANIIGLPGLGTFFAGKKISGTIQMIISITGLIITLTQAVKLIKTWYSDPFNIPEVPELKFFFIGIFLFFISLLWSVVSVLMIISKTKKFSENNNSSTEI